MANLHKNLSGVGSVFKHSVKNVSGFYHRLTQVSNGSSRMEFCVCADHHSRRKAAHLLHQPNLSLIDALRDECRDCAPSQPDLASLFTRTRHTVTPQIPISVLSIHTAIQPSHA